MNEDWPRPRTAVERDHILEPDCADGNPPDRVRRAIGQPNAPSAVCQQSWIAVARAWRRLRRGGELPLFPQFGVRLSAPVRITLPRRRIYRPGWHSGQQRIESRGSECAVALPHFHLDPTPVIEANAA